MLRIKQPLVTEFLDLSISMTLNDLEPLKEGFLMNFPQFLLKIDQDNLWIKFSALNADFNSPSIDSLG